jgi:hypothetical protein
MKKTSKHVGTGITRLRRETTEAETPEELVQLLHEISYSGKHPFEVFLDDLESDCVAYLKQSGLSINWKELRDLPDKDYDSRIGYSARFLQLIASLRGRLKRGETDADALQKAYELGALHQEARFKLKYEPDVKIGAPVRRGVKKAGDERAAKYSPRNLAMAKEFLRRSEGGTRLSPSKLKQDIGSKWAPPLGRSASIEAINRGLEESVRHQSKPDATSITFQNAATGPQRKE